MEGDDELPRLGEGYNDPSDIIKSALETGEEVPEPYDNATELVNWVENNLVLSQKDIDRLQQVNENMSWYFCDTCEEPYDMNFWTEEDEAEYRQGAEVKHTGVFVAYCDDHAEDREYFSFEETWFE